MSQVTRSLSVLSLRVLESLPALAVSGHGFEPGKTDIAERAAKLASSKTARNKAYGGYLEFHAEAFKAMGLPPEEPDAVLLHLSLPRCGLPDILSARASQCRWRHEPVTVKLGQGWDGLQLFSLDQIKAAIAWSNGRWCEVGGSVWKWHSPGDPGPNQLVHYTRIDGPQNVLADQVLPCGVNQSSECRMRLDSSEFAPNGLYQRFGYDYFRAVVTHEDGHKWGHDHSRDPAALMYPMARPEVLDLGGDDAPRHLATYGPPKVTPKPPPKPKPEPPTDRGSYQVDGYVYGRIDAISSQFARVRGVYSGPITRDQSP